MVKEKQPSFVFLIETLCRKQRMEWIRVKLGFTGYFVVDRVGRSGGLTLLWREAGALEIFNFSAQHINATIMDVSGHPHWKLTCFYGHPVCGQRDASWELLRHLQSFSPSPWMCVKDFNEIIEQSKKEGAPLRVESQMDGFRTAMEDCHLGDLGYHGLRFAWSNHRTNATFTKERLDRAVANREWCSLFSEFMVNILVARTSDHTPLQVCFAAAP
jgi:hypothetical protein